MNLKHLLAVAIVIVSCISCADESQFTNGFRLNLTGKMNNPENIGDNTQSAEQIGADLISLCEKAAENNELLTDTRTLSYESNWKMGEQCNWDKPEKQGKIRGSREWRKVFEIDSNRLVCSLDISSDEDLQYDDTLVLTLNEKVLAWGNLSIEDAFEKNQGIYKYDLDNILDQSMQTRSVGCVEGFTTCEVPQHDKPGNINISFSKELNDQFLVDIDQKGAEFTLRVFGDNDPEVDCSHNGLNLDITYSYIER